MVKKKVIAYNTYGKIHEYYPLISKTDYFGTHLNSMVKNFFNGSATKFASFFTNEKDLNLTELEEIKKMVENKIEKLKTDKTK